MSVPLDWAHLGVTRLNLGLIELLYSVALAAVVLVFDRKPRGPGFYAGCLLVLYCPVRFLLDGLRAADPGYLGWTTMQLACIPGTLLGGWMLLTANKNARGVLSQSHTV